MEIAFLGIDLTGIFESFFSLLIVVSVWVLGLIKNIITLIFDIASLDFFSEDAIGDLAGRIYMILGILMLFKITISCIQYLINPEKSEDKENGFGSIIKRTVIALLLIALVPSIFAFAKSSQVQISKFLPKVILGSEAAVDTLSIGEDIAYTSALGFFGYSSDSCNDGSIAGLVNKNGQVVKSNDAGVIFYNTDTIIGNADVIVKGNSCSGNSRYSFNYLCIFAAGFLIYILVSMAIDIGVRTIKMGLLQILSPIPIASYVDPKTSKKSFDAWTHQCVTVYADLFIRLGVIYFTLYLFMLIFGSFKGVYVINGSSIGAVRSSFVNVFIIVAMFMFAKSAPKFICDILGIKGDGNIGDMFKPAWNRASPAISSAINPLRNAAANGIYAQKNIKGGKGNRLRKVLRVAGATTGGFLAGARDAGLTMIGGKSSADLKQMREKSMAMSQKRSNRKGIRTVASNEHRSIGKLIEQLIGTDRENRRKAEEVYNNSVESANSKISDIREKMKGTNNIEELRKYGAQLADAESELNDLKTNRKAHIEKNMIEGNIIQTYNKKEKEKEELAKQIENTKDVDQRAQLIEKYRNVEAEVNQLSDFVTNESSMKVEVERRISEYDKLSKEYNSNWNKGLTVKDSVIAAISSDLGISGINGSSYVQVADTLKGIRSELWSGEAMSKLAQSPDIIEKSGGKTQLLTEFTTIDRMQDEGGIPKPMPSYSQMLDLKLKVDNGTITNTDYNNFGFKSVSDVRAAFTEIEKQAASEYISLAQSGKLVGGNSTITEALKRMRVEISNASISNSEKQAILKELDEDPGKFLKKASDYQQVLRTKGSRISAYNSGKKEN